ncbi:hypothetical protein S40285_06033 [Stachybotrys chlorohalonatus IBT 40285]|uniref:Uncharacterized protein n=1 Tax=Stachybotrys chlorohalonatus (strain IBT 40285) TaxID=1283841 RepID=A0A084Q8R9_STAC4|nr:hypothetical protein S40285_06033 [Stachybotrys chlorohalonata IBT 40285]
MGSSQSQNKPPSTDKQPSLYQRYQSHKRGSGASDEDILKYTGRSREQITAWAETKPGVGKNQLAGKAAIGSSGLGGVAMADGFGGWGPGAEPDGPSRGMKFPPSKSAETGGKEA